MVVVSEGLQSALLLELLGLGHDIDTTVPGALCLKNMLKILYPWCKYPESVALNSEIRVTCWRLPKWHLTNQTKMRPGHIHLK